MIVLTTDFEQTFAIIPTRQSDEDNNIILLEFVNETTKEIFPFSENIKFRDRDTLIIGADDFTFLKENTFYSLKVYFENTNEVIYKDKIFCTDQPKETYSINNGEYIAPQIADNTYITI